MPEVWFIRHGESIANIGGATRTPEEAELTPTGREQAQHTAAYVQREAKGQLVKIIASSYKRAQQTAQYTQCLISGTFVEVWPVDEFNYLALPADALTTTADRSPLVKQFWAKSSPFFQYEGRAESFAQFIRRAQKVIENLCACEDDQLVLVFSHQQFIQAIRWLLERGREVRSRDPHRREMLRFRTVLSIYPMPNGAILKTRLNSKKQQVISGFEVSHLPLKVPSKMPCVAIVPYVEARLPSVAVVPYMEAHFSEDAAAEPLSLGSGC